MTGKRWWMWASAALCPLRALAAGVRANAGLYGAIVLFSLVAAIGLFEIYMHSNRGPEMDFYGKLRTYSDIKSLAGGYYIASEFNDFELAPGFRGVQPSMEQQEPVGISINAHGLRGPEVELDQPADTFRVLVLGDSYPFGLYVDDASPFPRVLERYLRSKGRNVEVLNAGYTDGHCPDEHYSWLVNKGQRYKPDIVVYGFFIGNDLSCLVGDRKRIWRELDQRGLPVRIKTDGLRVDGWIRKPAKARRLVDKPIYRIPILRESYAAVVIQNVVSNYLERRSSKPSPPGGEAAGRARTGPPNDRHIWYRWMIQPESDAEMLKAEDTFFELVQGLEDASQEIGARFVLAMIPINFQVHPEFLDRVLDPRYWGRDYDLERDYFAEIKPRLDRMGIVYFDILRAMLTEDHRFFPDNGEVHFNTRGHEFAGESLGEFLLGEFPELLGPDRISAKVGG